MPGRAAAVFKGGGIVTTLADAAASLAARGIPVFPCLASKAPATERGFYAASTDPAEVRRMFASPAAVLIGMPTGVPTGIYVVDVDVKNGARGGEWLDANSHRLPSTRTHKTQSGGLHLLFTLPAGAKLRNSNSKLAPGVDTRGEGGFVIVPGSPQYAIADDCEPAEMPQWLVDQLTPPPAPAPQPMAPRARTDTHGTAYGMKALDDECASVCNAGFGTQEHTLNAAGLKLGALAAGGEIDPSYARSSLIRAALAMPSQGGREPWTPQDVQKKAERAFDDGMRKPRQAPPRAITRTTTTTTETVEFDRPEPPPHAEPPDYWQGEPDDGPPSETPGFIGVGAGAQHQQATGAHLKAEQPARVLPTILFADAAPSLDADDFLEGVLTRGAMSVIYGESNSGKTFFALDLALHVAAGRQWRDREADQGFVLYLALEGSQAILNRVAAFKAEHGFEDTSLPFAIAPVGVNLLDPEADAGAVIATIKALGETMAVKPILIVVDTLARAMAGGNENASEDMGALVINGDSIRRESGAHVMWIHHSGKDAAKGARGHSSLRAATDTEIEVVAEEGARTATVTKQRDMECAGAFGFTLKVVELGTNRRGKAVTSCVVAAGDDDAQPRASLRRMSGDQQQAMRVLHDALAEQGVPDFPGVPRGQVSIPEDWWRDRFYDRCKPGADRKTKEKAFRRASDALVGMGSAAINRGRAWAINSNG